MSKVFDFSGDDAFCPGGSIYPNPKDSSLFFPLDRRVDMYFPSHKRACISSSLYSEEILEQKKPTIDILPDECLFEVLRRIPSGQQRSFCAFVSKRWLMLLSGIHRDEICPARSDHPLETKEKFVAAAEVNTSETNKKDVACSGVAEAETVVEDLKLEGDGYLSRCLEGKKATDIRLASIAIGTGSRGGLGKLSIRGGNLSRGVTDLGLKAIARGCPSLRVLSLWNVSSIGDEGLSDIASGCRMVEEIDLRHCPSISDKAMLAVAKNCPKLISLTIESCSRISNDSLQSVGRLCPNLKLVSIKSCPLIGDQGITSLVSSARTLTKLSLQALNISDMSLAVIGHYGKALTDLSLIGLQNVTEKGFWVMGNGKGLQILRTFMITSCQGLTDIGLEAIGRGCPSLKQFCVCRSAFLSDNGLVSFSKFARTLESLQLEECHRITESGLFVVLINCSEKLKALSLVGCIGIKDSVLGIPFMSLCKSLRTLSVRNCPGFGNANLAILGKICPQLQYLELSGLNGITDKGFLLLIQCNVAGLAKVNLSNCANVTDKAVSAIALGHGGTLELLNLDGCYNVTDSSLVAIAKNCSAIIELDISMCMISNSGIAALACAGQLNLQILSLSNCSFISDKSLPFLKKLGETLVGLNIKNCSAISNSMVNLLVEVLWRCDILS